MAKYDHIDFTPPEDVQEAAQQGLDYRDEYGRGGTDTGIARARDLSNGRDMSPDTIGRMVSFFARHESNRNPDETEPDGGPTNGWIAWLLWGGDPGKRWSEKVKGQMDAADDKQTAERSLAEGDRRDPIKLFSYGVVDHPNGAFTVDSEFAASIVAHARHMREMGYYIPILRQHQEDGHVYGLLAEVWADEAGIWALPEFAGEWAAAYDAGHLRYWSPTFSEQWKCPHTGLVFAYALREVSAVSVPHQKNIGGASAHYSLAESGYATHRHKEDQMADKQEATTPAVGEEPTALSEHGEEQEMEEEEPKGPSLSDVMNAIMQLTALMSPEEKEMMDGDEEEEVSEMSELRKQVRALQEENARLDIARRLGEQPAETVKRLSALRRTDATLYDFTVSQIAAARSVPAPAPTPAAPKVTPLSEEIGGMGTQETEGKTFRSLCEEAKRNGVQRGLPLVKYLREKGITGDSPLYDRKVVFEVFGSRG